MKRNSTTLFLKSPIDNTTSIPWSNGAPDFSGFTEPTLSVLQTAWENFDGEVEVIPDPVPVAPVIAPREIDARRLRLALLQLNKLDQVEAAISTLDRAAQIEWEFATVIKEDYPLVQSLVTSLNIDVDILFDTAESLL